jgi:hypothetical protein
MVSQINQATDIFFSLQLSQIYSWILEPIFCGVHKKEKRGILSPIHAFCSIGQGEQ